MSLRDALQRTADQAPRVPIDTDQAWATGRRRHHRRTAGSVVAAAAAVALVAGVLGLLGGLPGRSDPPVAGTSTLGVPDRLYAVPEHLQGRREDGTRAGEVSDDLAPGRAAVAFVTSDGVPVVVDADDGGYHLLDLPGFLGNDPFVARGLHGAELTVALSPDGRSLAYGWARVGPDAATDPVPSGVAVLGLDTGDLRTVQVDGLEGTQAVRFSWSPDGQWLAWAGYQLGSWTEASMGDSSAVAGLIAPGATTSLPVSTYLEQDAIAVDDRGRVLLVGNGGSPGRDGVAVRSVVDPSLGTDPAVSASGLVVVGGRQLQHVAFAPAAVGLRDRGARPGLQQQRVVAPPEDPVGAHPVGWVGDTALVAISPDDPEDDTGPRLLLVGPGTSAFEVTQVEAEVGDQISVATDLMTLQRPTVTRPAPDWPWSTQRWLATGAGLLAAGLVLVAAGVAVARSIRRGGSLPHKRGLVGFLVGLGAGTAAMVTLVGVGLLILSWFTVVTFGGLLVAVGLLVATTRPGRWLGLGLVAAAPLTYAVLALEALLSVGT